MLFIHASRFSNFAALGRVARELEFSAAKQRIGTVRAFPLFTLFCSLLNSTYVMYIEYRYVMESSR